MATKKYDLAVKTGSYMKDGEEKGRYENVGSIWQGDNGHYLVLKRTFNPAGVPFKDGSDSIFVSMFEPRQDSQEQPRQQKQSRQSDDMPSDDIPF
jgi:hypothetical protein